MAIYVESKVDPRDLRANIRHRGSQALPKKVRDAMTNLQDDVYEAAIRQSGYVPAPKNILAVDIYFPDMRCDLDGPIKHMVDAIQHGLRKAGHAFNDRSIWEIHIRRNVGTPGIVIVLYGRLD